MLNQTTEHALRALLYLGRQPEGERVSAAVISRGTGIPAAYLAKLLQSLASAGLVRGSRGRFGGYELTVPVAEIRVGELIERYVDNAGSGLCLLGDRPCDRTSPCTAHTLWTDAQRRAKDEIGGLRLSDLLNGSQVAVGNGGERAPLMESITTNGRSPGRGS